MMRGKTSRKIFECIFIEKIITDVLANLLLRKFGNDVRKDFNLDGGE